MAVMLTQVSTENVFNVKGSYPNFVSVLGMCCLKHDYMYRMVLRIMDKSSVWNDLKKWHTSDMKKFIKISHLLNTNTGNSGILNNINDVLEKPDRDQNRKLSLNNEQTKTKTKNVIPAWNDHIFFETFYFTCKIQKLCYYQRLFLCLIFFIFYFLKFLIILLFFIYIFKVFFKLIFLLYNRTAFPTFNKPESSSSTFDKDEKSLDEVKVCATVEKCHFSTPRIANIRDDSFLEPRIFSCDNRINNNCNRFRKILQDVKSETNSNCAHDLQVFSEKHDIADFAHASCANTSIDILFNKLYRNSANDLNYNLSRNEFLFDLSDFYKSQLPCDVGIGVSILRWTSDNIDESRVLQNECVSFFNAKSDVLIQIPVIYILVSTTNYIESTKCVHRDHRNIYMRDTNCCCGNTYCDISRFKPNTILLDTNFVTTKLQPLCSCFQICFYGSEDIKISTKSEPLLSDIHRAKNCSYASETCNACKKCDSCLSCNGIKSWRVQNNVFAFETNEAETPFQKTSRICNCNVQTSVQRQLCWHGCINSNLFQRKRREIKSETTNCIKRFDKERTCLNQFIKQEIQKISEKRAYKDGELSERKTVLIQCGGQTIFQRGMETTRDVLDLERILLDRLFKSEGLIQKGTIETDKGKSKIKRKARIQQLQIPTDVTCVLGKIDEQQSLHSGKETDRKDEDEPRQQSGKEAINVSRKWNEKQSFHSEKGANRENKEGQYQGNGTETTTLCFLKKEGTDNYRDNGTVQRSGNSNEYTGKGQFQKNRQADKNKGDNSFETCEMSGLFFIDIPCNRIILTFCQFNQEQLAQWIVKLQKLPQKSVQKFDRNSVKCNAKRKFQRHEKVKNHNKEHWIQWKYNPTHTQGNLTKIRRRRQNLQNRPKVEIKRCLPKTKQEKITKQELRKKEDKLIYYVAKGSLTFIGTLLFRAGIEQNPGPWNGHSNREELKQSENYVWKTGDALGRGATAVVYKARSKHTRDLFAVKVFHDRVSTQFANVALREIEVLRRLKHRNVISIFCTEQELNTGSFVLVMELCTGGSLYSMLDQPKFAFGFPEEEFLVVIKDIAEGMKYIRQQEYVHRDIKPGNIMRFIDENGSSVYKFTDFGAARQLDEQESFSSIYGTEEYLDPDMYQKAVLRQHIGTFFDASVDLWSLGVTIFHVATGFLPFQPYGGRKNTATMFKITSEKESGVISGIQSEENGPIGWSKELPRSCMLSSNLKSLITPMLAGMMESNRGLRWSFEKFFDTVNTIVNMVSLKVFYSSRGCNFRIYIDGKSRFAALQEQIAMETEIPAFEQLLIFNNKELKEVVDATSEIQSFSKIILEGQLFLFNRERYQQDTLIIPEIITFPAIQGFINYDRDSSIAHSSCAVAYYIDKVIAWLIDAQKLMQQADTLLRDHISRITSRIDDSLPDMYRLLGETNKRQTTFYRSYEQVLSLYKILSKTNKHSKIIGPLCEEAETKLAKILTDRSAEEVIKKAENRAEEIKVYTSVLIEKLKEQEQEAISNSVGCLDTDKCLLKSKNLCYKIQEIWTTFQKHRKQPPTPHEQENHASDRMKLSDHCANLSYLLQSHCLYHYQTLHRAVVKQEFLLVKNIQRTKKVDANIWSVIECQGKLSARIDKLQEDCLTLNRTYVDVLTREMEASPLLPRGAMSMCPVGTDLSVDNAYTTMVQNIEKEFKTLNDGSSELQSLIMKNDLKLREANELAEGFLKELEKDSGKRGHTLPIPDSFEQAV